MRHYDIRVFGRVQGVGFRYAAQKQARALRLKGWVRNEADGSVSAAIEGDESNCHTFIRWCRQGPGFSWVERIEAEEGACAGLPSFHIR